jgi:hypothetical protein
MISTVRCLLRQEEKPRKNSTEETIESSQLEEEARGRSLRNPRTFYSQIISKMISTSLIITWITWSKMMTWKKKDLII